MQALGPEALIPLTLLTREGGCAMLCGDPRYPFPCLHAPMHTPAMVLWFCAVMHPEVIQAVLHALLRKPSPCE